MTSYDDSESGRSPKETDERIIRRGKRRRKLVDSDDVVEIVQIVAEEAAGLGAAKRAGKKLQDYIARKYIAEIERHKEKHELATTTISDLVRANATLVEGNKALTDLLAEKEAIIASQQARLDKLDGTSPSAP